MGVGQERANKIWKRKWQLEKRKDTRILFRLHSSSPTNGPYLIYCNLIDMKLASLPLYIRLWIKHTQISYFCFETKVRPLSYLNANQNAFLGQTEASWHQGFEESFIGISAKACDLQWNKTKIRRRKCLSWTKIFVHFENAPSLLLSFICFLW